MTNDNQRQRVALVTGSSTGIGAAVAIELAHQGWDLVIHGRAESTAILSVKNTIKSLGRVAKIRYCDFENTADLEDFAESCWHSVGHVDALINNAGGDVLTGEWSERQFLKKLEYLLKVDVLSTLVLSRCFGAKMIERSKTTQSENGSNSIVNVGWDQAAQGMAGESGEMFATTKGAIMSMSRALAQSLAPHVRVNCVAPGWIQTKWGENASEAWHQRAARESLMDRWGNPQDVADMVAFLVGEKAKFVSGQVMRINGGFKFSQEKDQ